MEGLFSLFIVFMVLGGLAHTLAQAAGVKKNTRNMDQAIEEYHALFTMRADVVAALTIKDPKPNETSSALELTRINPELDYAMRTDVINDPLDAFEPAEQVTVAYGLEDGLLKRSLTYPTGDPTAERLLAVEKLEVRLESAAPSLLTIKLDLVRDRITKQRLMKVALN